MAINLSKVNVLLVEDTLPMQKLMRSVLEALNLPKPYVADNGDDAYSLYKHHLPDIIITDWLMKPTDGLELIRKIRTNKDSPNKMVPIILVTGYSSLNRVKEARDMGVTEFLVKPFTANDLSKRLMYVISHPRNFVPTGKFFGPDRRRKKLENYQGPLRRESDHKPKRVTQSSTWDIGLE